MKARIIFSLNLLFIFIFKILKYNRNYFITANAENLINNKNLLFSSDNLYNKSEIKKIPYIDDLNIDSLFNLKENFWAFILIVIILGIFDAVGNGPAYQQGSENQ